ncbi:hypothetical protein BD779DRAFT_1677841 [Infundibulicybe gibba]|nr:hypothetical protein BD779DRAFT_1677841 [Infundibulicybe gibba]
MSQTDALLQVLDDGGQYIMLQPVIGSIIYLASAQRFDHILTFPEEVELIWKSKWNFSKILYLWVCAAFSARNSTIFFAATLFCLGITEVNGLTAARLHGFCGIGIFYRIEGAVITIIIGIVDLVLAVRVWVLYARDKRVLWFLVSMTTIETITMMTLDGITITVGVRGDFALHAPTTTERLILPRVGGSPDLKDIHYVLHDRIQMREDALRVQEWTYADLVIVPPGWRFLVPCGFIRHLGCIFELAFGSALSGHSNELADDCVRIPLLPPKNLLFTPASVSIR